MILMLVEKSAFNITSARLSGIRGITTLPLAVFFSLCSKKAVLKMRLGGFLFRSDVYKAFECVWWNLWAPVNCPGISCSPLQMKARRRGQVLSCTALLGEFVLSFPQTIGVCVKHWRLIGTHRAGVWCRSEDSFSRSLSHSIWSTALPVFHFH